MKKTRGYHIVRASCADELSQHVNEMMKDGWSPQGSMVVSKQHSYGRVFYQPMVKS